MKKIVILLVVLLLVGCTNNDTTSNENEPNEVLPGDESVSTLEPTEGKSLMSYDEKNLTYDLVWSDEFDYTGKPDPEKWSYDVGGSGWGNNELQYYTEGDNAYVEDGYLTITAKKEQFNKLEYTSSRLITKNKGDWLYGKIEVYAKLPEGRGTWPAIWMLPTDWKYGGWPRSGEIDIMEHVGYEMGRIHGTVHTNAFNHMNGTQLGKSVIRDDAHEAFHLYSIEWYPDKIKFFVDNKIYFVFKPSNMKSDITYQEWPFDQQFHLLLNIAVGGNWGGANGVDESIFPQEMLVDYVRVYQSEEINKLIEE